MKLVTFDLETTGVDTENDRILTCFMRAKDGDKVVFEQNWVIDPGVEIPKEASDVHGMDTAWVREHGRNDVADAIREIHLALSTWDHAGYVIAGYNHSFDLSILDSEIKRYNDPAGLSATLTTGSRFIDPIIIDRAIDKYRKGSRKLVDVARHYGIEVDEDSAHDASYDVHLTEQLIPKVLNKAWIDLESERLGLTPDQFVDKLQEWQAKWKRGWADHLTEYFQSQGKLEEDGSKIVVNGNFPY